MAQTAPLIGSQTRILLVEDEALIAMDLRRRLQSLGYTVTSIARTAQDALRLAFSDAPNLILMDIHLQGEKDGIQAADEIRKHLDIPVVYLTAHSDNLTIERAKQTGPFGYITKPFETADVRAQIEVALAKHQTEKTLRNSQARLSSTLRHREQELSELLDHTPDIVIRLDRGFRFTYVNARTAQVAGIPPEAFIGKTSSEIGLPQELIDLWMQPTRRAFDTGQVKTLEFSYPSPGGATEWEERFIPEFAPDGAVESLLIIGRDITERKRLERLAESSRDEIRALAASLMTAQEEERRRVSRELHDQTCQQLASLAIDIAGLAAEPTLPEAVRRSLRSLQARVVRTAEETRHISHELHPSVLDDLGVAASLEELCAQFSGRGTQINMQISRGALRATLSREIASCLYRIAQESLQNVVKHAGARHATVKLKSQKEKMQLTVEDDGVGFDPAAVRAHGGLGLIGMEERARLVNGILSISTGPRLGTRITLEIPLNPRRYSSHHGPRSPEAANHTHSFSNRAEDKTAGVLRRAVISTDYCLPPT